MNHPYELLADLVDGTLDETTLAGVRAHLDTCAECRQDVALATSGRDAARSLPQVPAPTDLHDRVVAAAGGAGGRGVPLWYRWAGAAAAAAAVIVLAIALPNVGGGDDRTRAEDTFGAAEVSGPAAEDSVTGRQLAIEELDRNFDEEGLRNLAKNTATSFAGSTSQAPQAGTLSAGDPAVECVVEAWQLESTGELVRVIQAKFHGEEAYFAVYLESLGADQLPDIVSVYAVSRSGCQPLTVVGAPI